MKILFLVFPRHAEVWKFSIWSFRATRKHENPLFGLSAPRGSMKIIFFALDTLYLTPKFLFLCLIRCIQLQIPLFGASYVVSNSKILFLVLHTLYVAWKFPFSCLCCCRKHFFFSIWCLCRCQKHFFSPFDVYVVDRSAYFLHLVFMSLSEALFFSISCLCRCQKRLFSPFGVYVVVRSAYFLHFMFMSLTEALFSLFHTYCIVFLQIMVMRQP